ncbi:MAG: PSD1 domain-containing protein [Verrucomicrobia bacterium]|nr:PSD1 domain-containing protein [Verrucomicrobiota bacterium]
MNLDRAVFPSLFASLLVAVATAVAADKPTEKISSDQMAFFEKKIRPVLVAKCYKCHAADAEKVKGGLLLDTRDGIRMGGATGHAVEPGDLKGSLLIAAIRGEKKDQLMPPKEKLAPEVIADFEKWVLMGAPDPRDGKAKLAKKPDLAEGKNFWSFQPVKPVAVPQPKDTKWSASDIDRFVLKKLEENKLKPAGDAGPHTFIRRLYFDLIGLPPSPEQVQAFVKDCGSPAPHSAFRIPRSALEKVVDQLLASPHFGERWGRHWLDVARYAESSGKERNFAYPEAWRYRDYVIASFNADKPYDRFLREQVAGDLLPAKDAAERNDQLIATGFLALGPKGLNERNREAFVMEIVDEQIDVTTRAVLGVTVSCARCHDHKFDPIPQRDYYAVAGIFKSTETHFGIGGGGNGKNRQPSTHVPLVKSFTPPSPLTQSAAAPVQVASASGGKLTPEMEAKLKQFVQKNPKLAVRLKTMSEAEKVAAFERLQGNVKGVKPPKKPNKYPETPEAPKANGEPNGQWAMAVLDGKPADCPIYIRGELEEKGPVVPRGFVTVLGALEPAKIAPGQSGRLELANWLTSPENPLTARVMANRVWQHLFGEGIVSTPDNFGATGERPTHPELLDYLANSLVANGWSVKKLVREVVLSRTYQLSSASDAKSFAADPDNNFLWRANQRRLDAESIRDGILAVSGRLSLEPATGSPLSSLEDTDLGRRGRTAVNADSRHRSVYLPIIRDMLPEALDLFDFAEPSLVVAAREVTTVPSQALYMLNSPFIQENAAAFAKRFQGTSADPKERITAAYLTAFSRPATAAEIARGESYLKDRAAERGSSTENALTTFCQALFASAEFRYVK